MASSAAAVWSRSIASGLPVRALREILVAPHDRADVPVADSIVVGIAEVDVAIVVAAVEAVQRTAVQGAKFDTSWFVLKRHVFLLGSFYSGSRIAPETLRWGGAAVHLACAVALLVLVCGWLFWRSTRHSEPRRVDSRRLTARRGPLALEGNSEDQ